jgi:hypothetical protein
MTTRAHGTFEITMHPEPPYDSREGVTLGRTAFDKVFSGDLVATSRVEMIGVRTPVATSAGYVAVERVTGALHGRSGSFVLLQRGTMHDGAMDLSVIVSPGSGTGQLAGISGRLSIEIVEGQHHYSFDYELPQG